MSQSTPEPVCAQTFSGIRFEPRPCRTTDDRAERERRVEIYTRQLAEHHVVKPKRLCFGGATCRSVRCVDHDQVFDSARDAGQALGLSPAAVRAAIRRQGRCGKLKFEWCGEPRRLTPVRCRAVWCSTTAERFDSISDAARAHGVAISTMFDAVKSGRPTHQGRRYVYLTPSTQSRAA